LTAYAIALIDIHDRQAYSQYEAGFMTILTRYAGELLAVDERPRVIEGQWPATRTVLLRFADTATFDRWYGSDEYQALMSFRTAASVASVALIQGLPE